MLCAALAGCGEEPAPERVWTPADHAQPLGQQVDPSRQAAPGGGARTPERREDPDARRRRAATALWNVSCAGCHGSGGEGAGPVPDLRDPAWQARSPDEAIVAVIRNGRGAMPGFANLDASSVQSLVALIRTFAAE